MGGVGLGMCSILKDSYAPGNSFPVGLLPELARLQRRTDAESRRQGSDPRWPLLTGFCFGELYEGTVASKGLGWVP